MGTAEDLLTEPCATQLIAIIAAVPCSSGEGFVLMKPEGTLSSPGYPLFSFLQLAVQSQVPAEGAIIVESHFVHR